MSSVIFALFGKSTVLAFSLSSEASLPAMRLRTKRFSVVLPSIHGRYLVMEFLRENLKVLYAVVVLYSVYVMNNFMPFEFSSDVVLEYVAMLVFITSIDANQDIPMIIDRFPSLPVRLYVKLKRASFRAALRCRHSIRINKEFFGAIAALLFLHRHTYILPLYSRKQLSLSV